ncbi:MAG: hypothetical protein U5N58_11035 [Actinomycetota bacterium]|nr:hypothetical protein [Actinomycetota bacterium]
MPGITSNAKGKAQGILSTLGFANVEFIVEDSEHVAPGIPIDRNLKPAILWMRLLL